jgi:hypothetical protein
MAGTLSRQPLPLARDLGDRRLLPDRGDQHPHGSIDSDPRRDVLYKPPDTAATEAAKRTLWARFIWIGAHGPWCAMWDSSRCARNDPPQVPPNRTVDHGGVYRSALCLLLSGAGRPQSAPSQRLGLYRGRPRRSGRGDEWAGAAVAVHEPDISSLAPMKIFVHPVKHDQG